MISNNIHTDIVTETVDSFNLIKQSLNQDPKLKAFDRVVQSSLVQQRSEEWFKLREGTITGSKVASILKKNNFKPLYEFIVSELFPSYESNDDMFRGTMFEIMAKKIYEKVVDRKVFEVGLVKGCGGIDPREQHIAGSSDGIMFPCFDSQGKLLETTIEDVLDNTTLIEIKCPKKMNIVDGAFAWQGVVPTYYYDQMQMCMHCAGVHKQKFIQFKFTTLTKQQYDSIKEEGISMTYNQSFDNRIFFCKDLDSEICQGQFVELKPKYAKNRYSNKFIYPNDISMNKKQYDEWSERTIQLFKEGKLQFSPEDYQLYQVVYWQLEQFHESEVKFDENWKEKNLEIICNVNTFIQKLKANKDLKADFKMYNKLQGCNDLKTIMDYVELQQQSE